MIKMFRKLYSKINQIFITYYCKGKGVEINKRVIFKKKPYIIRHKSANIFIKEGAIINSSNKGYHLNMFQRCKLYADRPNSMIIIGENSRIHGTCIHAYNSITIGKNCLIAANTQIIDGNGHLKCFENPAIRISTTDEGKPIIVEDNVWIAANCIILGGTIIGEGSIITAGSVVKGYIPPKSIYGGNPAILIKHY